MACSFCALLLSDLRALDFQHMTLHKTPHCSPYIAHSPCLFLTACSLASPSATNSVGLIFANFATVMSVIRTRSCNSCAYFFPVDSVSLSHTFPCPSGILFAIPFALKDCWLVNSLPKYKAVTVAAHGLMKTVP